MDGDSGNSGYVSCQSYPTGHSSADAHVNAHVDITTGSLCRAACRRRFELERSGGAAEAAQQDEVGEAAQQDEAEEEGEGKNENDGGGDKIAESESSNYERDYESYKSYKSYDELYRGDHGLYMTYGWLSYSYVYDDLGGRADDDVVADDLGTGAEENDGLGTGAEEDENDGSGKSGSSSSGGGSDGSSGSSSGGRLYHKDGLLLLTAECRCNVVSVDDYQHHQQQQQQQQQQQGQQQGEGDQQGGEQQQGEQVGEEGGGEGREGEYTLCGPTIFGPIATPAEPLPLCGDVVISVEDDDQDDDDGGDGGGSSSGGNNSGNSKTRTRTRTIDGISSYDDCAAVCIRYSPYTVLEHTDNDYYYATTGGGGGGGYGSSSSEAEEEEEEVEVEQGAVAWWDVPIEYSSDVGCTCLLHSVTPDGAFGSGSVAAGGNGSGAAAGGSGAYGSSGDMAAVVDVKICHSDRLGRSYDRFGTGDNMSGGAIIGVIIAFIAFFFVLALSRRSGADGDGEDEPDPDLLAFRVAWQVQNHRGGAGGGGSAGAGAAAGARPGAQRLGRLGMSVVENDEERRRIRKELIKSRLYRHKLDEGGVQGLASIIATQRADDEENGDESSEDYEDDSVDDSKEDKEEDEEVKGDDEEGGNATENANNAANTDSGRSRSASGGNLVDTLWSGLGSGFGTAVSTVRSIGVGGIGGGDGDGTTVPSECSICLADYEQGDVVVWAKTDRCNHVYHEECIEQWLACHDNCPLCREPILEDDVSAEA
mmetsp:Transcript_27081/g.59225  ORF Transcript_27081/g.59225 Transcript_27081/m.59225 type:complete len:761 (+) Transcript_27081:309-2591(+)